MSVWTVFVNVVAVYFCCRLFSLIWRESIYNLSVIIVCSLWCYSSCPSVKLAVLSLWLFSCVLGMTSFMLSLRTSCQLLLCILTVKLRYQQIFNSSAVVYACFCQTVCDLSVIVSSIVLQDSTLPIASTSWRGSYSLPPWIMAFCKVTLTCTFATPPVPHAFQLFELGILCL